MDKNWRDDAEQDFGPPSAQTQDQADRDAAVDGFLARRAK